MDSVTASAPTIFLLRGGGPDGISLDAEGLRHPTGGRFGGLVYTPYRDITHLATSSRAIWLGTRRSVYVIARRQFVDPHGPEHLVRALLAQIARQPGGSAQLARMAEVEETARGHVPLRATWTLFVLCAALYVAELAGGDSVRVVGYFTWALVADGDWWRIVTANLLHANTAHLVVNLVGLLAVGSLVERALGTVATAFVMVCAGLGSMAASVWTPLPVVGVSGILSGLIAAVLWLELRFPDALPAWWRVPRRALFGVIGLTAVLSFLPFVAGAAHAGGFVGGGLAAAAVAWRGPRTRPSGFGLRLVTGASAAVVAFAIAAAASQLLAPGEFTARHAIRLSRMPGVTADELNDAAWMIAIDEHSSPELLAAALELAERAVDDTGREEPRILDTLAEVHFQLGHRAEAVAVIEEAILRDPEKEYYREQRRRFLGERDPHDRPEYVPQEPQREVRPEEPGVSV